MTDQFDRAQELEQMTRDIALQNTALLKQSVRFIAKIATSPFLKNAAN